MVKIGINGFGRIGRVIFRTCIQNKELEITAINDPGVDIDYICYLIKFDSTHGKFKRDVTFSANEITIDDKKIKVFCEKSPSDIPWHSAAVQYVVEASGMFTSHEKASSHLASETVKRVIVTAPTVDIPMLILGVNKEQINAEQKVISCASSTLYCLAPIIKILEENYGVAEGFVTSIHAMTPSLKPLDGLCLKGKHWRDHRSIHQNIIPAATGACKALGKIIPQAKDKLIGLAFRVPIVNVSVLDISVRLKKSTTIRDIIKCVETESKSNMKNIIKISKDQEVSSDFLGDENSCILDINSSLQLNPNFFKLICWYENEYSYACRVIDSIKFSEDHYKLEMTNNISCNRIIGPRRLVNRKPVPYFSKECINNYCHLQNNAKKFSASKAKLPQQIFFKKPLSLPNTGSNELSLRESKNSNDIFKVWNDEMGASKPLVKESGNLFFQSSIILGPSYMKCNNKMQECLEELKKEVPKMDNVTENLSTQSNQSKYESNIFEENPLEKEVGNKDTNRQEFYNTKSTTSVISSDVPACEDFQSSISIMDKNVFKSFKNKNVTISKTKNTSDLNEKPIVRESIELQQHDNKNYVDEFVNAKITETRTLFQCHKLDKQNELKYNDNNNFTKTNSVWEIQQHAKVENTTSNIKKSIRASTDRESNTKLKIDLYAAEAKYEFTNIFTENSIQCNFQRDKVDKLHSPNNNADTILIDNTKAKFKKPNKSTLNGIEPTNIKAECNESEDKKITNKREIRKKIIQGIIRELSVEPTLEERTHSPSVANTNSTISNEDYKPIDIYDKLDSTSATDSDNSFHINEKKSQVITITDLSSSAEDLARLDKICRIIEISDELSDRLFSVLNNNNDGSYKNKKWSLKDLCERLKLDEFCDNVFGQSMT